MTLRTLWRDLGVIALALGAFAAGTYNGRVIERARWVELQHLVPVMLALVDRYERQAAWVRAGLATDGPLTLHGPDPCPLDTMEVTP